MSLFFKSKTGIFLNGIVLLPKNAKELFVVFFVLKCNEYFPEHILFLPLSYRKLRSDFYI